ncbi:carbohydrate ABC transporter permease [Vibrio sp. VB16]|uniref:carbohydrate ABC transporter permease n=1 Tax=Vibrio sp. VB16 TaxID=2785746 RepID=UPI0018A0F78E|nr:sugar ABC transporter permease [Vibrio sp. VB16]UGA57693.1 sugar ABC transporter permease [Vibrio sp. VB16]
MNSTPLDMNVSYVRKRSILRQFGRYLFLVPATVIFMVFIAYPIAWVVTNSTFDGESVALGNFVGLQHYLTVITDPVFWVVMRNMFLWAAITIPVQMLIGGVIAYYVEFYTERWRTFFRTLFFIPVVTSVSVVSLIWIQIYAPYYGIGQEYLKLFGIELANSPLGDPQYTIFALIVVNIWQWTGFSMLMYIAGLSNLPREILDAARVDGAKGLRMAVSIIIPMLSSSTKSLLMLGIIGTLQTFPVVFLMTNGGPNRASEIFGTYIFKQSFVIGDLGVGAALSVIVLLIAFILSVLQIVYLGGQFDSDNKRNTP